MIASLAQVGTGRGELRIWEQDSASGEKLKHPFSGSLDFSRDMLWLRELAYNAID